MGPKPGQSLPPIIRTSDPDSFAAFTFKQRLPGMLERIIAKNGLNRSEARKLEQLKLQLHSGVVQLDLSEYPYLADQMIGKSLKECGPPSEMGFSLCAYTLNVAFEEILQLLKGTARGRTLTQS